MRIKFPTMSRISLSLSLAALSVSYAYPALADCPDKPISCDFGAIGRQGQCYHVFSCKDCGPRHCPTYPRSYAELPNKVALTSCPQAISRATDGCSVPVSDPASNTYKQLLKAACDEHDICYSVKNSGKGTCDNDFRKNMEHICRSYYTGFQNSVQLGSCLAAVGVWYVAVAEKGQQAYNDDQVWAQSHCQ